MLYHTASSTAAYLNILILTGSSLQPLSSTENVELKLLVPTVMSQMTEYHVVERIALIHPRIVTAYQTLSRPFR